MFPENISQSSTYFAQRMLKINRKEGIRDRYNYLIPSVQNTKIERMAYLKQRHHNQNTTNRKAKGQFFLTNIGQTSIETKNSNRNKHAKTYNDRNSKPQQKHCLGTVRRKFTSGCVGEGRGRGSFNRYFVATTLALSSAVLYTRHLFSPGEGFLTHQCNISWDTKIKRIQRWNNEMRTRQQEITEIDYLHTPCRTFFFMESAYFWAMSRRKLSLEAIHANTEWVLYLPYLFKETGCNKRCRPRSNVAECGICLGLNCLPLIQQL